MNAIRQTLQDFLANSTPEQLRAELAKGHRPFLQKLEDPILLVEQPFVHLPATVSFFQGEFAEEDHHGVIRTSPPAASTDLANEDLALAA